MYNISEKTKRNLELSIGSSLDNLKNMSADDEKKWIENKIGHSLKISKKRKHGLFCEGNPLLSRRKIRTIEDLNSKSKKIFGV